MKKLLLSAALVFGLSQAASAAGSPSLISGKNLVMEGAQCAGWYLDKSGKKASAEDEVSCSRGNFGEKTWDVVWVSGDVFFFRETVRPNETSPARVFVYKINSINGDKLKMTNYWTGWNNYPSEVEEYRIK